MILRFLNTIILILTIYNLSAQEVKFDKVKQFYGTGNVEIYSFTLDDDGNAFIGGQFSDSIFIADTVFRAAGLWNTNIFLAKLDPDLELIWIRHFGGYNASYHPIIRCDRANNIVMLAEFYSGITVNGEEYIPGGPSIVKFDSTGTVLWIKSHFDNYFHNLYDVELDLNDNIIFTGTYRRTFTIDDRSVSSSGEYDIVFAKMSPEGDVIFLKTFGNDEYDGGHVLETDRLGNIYLGGTFTSESIRIDGVNFYNPSDKYYPPSKSDRDILLCKFSHDGLLIKGISFTGKENDRINDITVDDSLNLYITGSTERELASSDSTFIIDVMDRTSSFLIKFDDKGNYQWDKRFENENGGKLGYLKVNSQGEIFLSVTYSDEFMLDSLPIASATGYFLAYLKLSDRGDIKWIVPSAGYPSGIFLDKTDNLWIYGRFNGVLNLENTSLESLAKSDGFILRIPGYTADAGTNSAYCIGDSVLLGGKFSAYNGTPPYSYQWSPGHLLSNDTLGHPHTRSESSQMYYLTVTDSVDYQSFDSVWVRVDREPPLTFSIGNDTAICQGDSINLYPEPSQIGDLSWSTKSTKSFINVWEPDIYSLIVTNGCGEKADMIMVSDIIPRQVFLGEDQHLEYEDSLIIYPEGSFLTYAWGDGSERSYFVADSTNLELGFNTISLSVTDENRCSSNASLRIFLEDQIVPPGTINDLIIYPNPFSSYIAIGSKSIDLPVFEIELIDSEGHIVDSKMKDPYTNVRFNTSNLAAGAYFLRISSSTGTNLIKIIRIN